MKSTFQDHAREKWRKRDLSFASTDEFSANAYWLEKLVWWRSTTSYACAARAVKLPSTKFTGKTCSLNGYVLAYLSIDVIC
jgi:hypothetical protein